MVKESELNNIAKGSIVIFLSIILKNNECPGYVSSLSFSKFRLRKLQFIDLLISLIKEMRHCVKGNLRILFTSDILNSFIMTNLRVFFNKL